jgi:hypothetical protein
MVMHELSGLGMSGQPVGWSEDEGEESGRSCPDGAAHLDEAATESECAAPLLPRKREGGWR